MTPPDERVTEVNVVMLLADPPDEPMRPMPPPPPLRITLRVTVRVNWPCFPVVGSAPPSASSGCSILGAPRREICPAGRLQLLRAFKDRLQFFHRSVGCSHGKGSLPSGASPLRHQIQDLPKRRVLDIEGDPGAHGFVKPDLFPSLPLQCAYHLRQRHVARIKRYQVVMGPPGQPPEPHARHGHCRQRDANMSCFHLSAICCLFSPRSFAVAAELVRHSASLRQANATNGWAIGTSDRAGLKTG